MDYTRLISAFIYVAV